MNNRFRHTGKVLIGTLVALISLSCNPPNTTNQTNIAKNNPKNYNLKFIPTGGPPSTLPCSDKYSIRLFNLSMSYSYAYVNDTLATGAILQGRYIDITGWLNKGTNNISFTFYPDGSPTYSWGYEIKKNDTIIYTNTLTNTVLNPANIVGDKYVLNTTIIACEEKPISLCTTQTDANGNSSGKCFSCPPGQNIVFIDGQPTEGCKPTGNLTIQDYFVDDNNKAPFGIAGLNRAAVHEAKCPSN